jgi:hypothetical protein
MSFSLKIHHRWLLAGMETGGAKGLITNLPSRTTVCSLVLATAIDITFSQPKPVSAEAASTGVHHSRHGCGFNLGTDVLECDVAVL